VRFDEPTDLRPVDSLNLAKQSVLLPGIELVKATQDVRLACVIERLSHGVNAIVHHFGLTYGYRAFRRAANGGPQSD